MKITCRLLAVLAVLLTLATRGRAPAKEALDRHDDIEPSLQFVFHAVLEGLYEDGVSDEDVKQILMRKEKQSYFHFIYSCPLCNAAIWALEAYLDRPKSFYGLKRPGSTFGHGLSEAQHAKLFSDEPQERLALINSLVKTWLDRRIKATRLTAKERTTLLSNLETQRKKGMEALKSFRKKEHGDAFGVAEAAPAYVGLEECAVCNGAVGKPMKLPEPRRK